MCVQTANTGPHGASRSTSSESRATLGRPSAYRVVDEAAVSCQALLVAHMDAGHAAMRLDEIRAE